MGKQFEKAKKRIEFLQKKIGKYDDELNDLVAKMNKLENELHAKQREWYGKADGDVLYVSDFEKMLKKSKRWLK